MTQIEQVVPGVKEQVGRWVPGFVGEPSASDVSGADVWPVPGFPVLVRSHFARGEKTVEVRYAGRGVFDSMRALPSRLRCGGIRPGGNGCNTGS